MSIKDLKPEIVLLPFSPSTHFSTNVPETPVGIYLTKERADGIFITAEGDTLFMQYDQQGPKKKISVLPYFSRCYQDAERKNPVFSFIRDLEQTDTTDEILYIIGHKRDLFLIQKFVKTKKVYLHEAVPLPDNLHEISFS